MADEATIRIKVEEDTPPAAQPTQPPEALTPVPTPPPQQPTPVQPVLPPEPAAVTATPTVEPPITPDIRPNPVLDEVFGVPPQPLPTGRGPVAQLTQSPDITVTTQGTPQVPQATPTTQPILQTQITTPPTSIAVTTMTVQAQTVNVEGATTPIPLAEQTPQAQPREKPETPKKPEDSTASKVFSGVQAIFGPLIGEVSQVVSVFMRAKATLESLGDVPKPTKTPDLTIPQPTRNLPTVTTVTTMTVQANVVNVSGQQATPLAHSITTPTKAQTPEIPEVKLAPTKAPEAEATPAATGAIGKLAVAGAAVAVAVTVLTKAVGALDAAVTKGAQYNAQVAQAEALAEIKLMRGDIQRANEFAPQLVNFAAARSELQNKYEDAKIKFLAAIEPLLSAAMEAIGGIVDVLGDIFKVLAEIGQMVNPEVLKWLISPLGTALGKIREALQPALAQAGDLTPAQQAFNWSLGPGDEAAQ